MGDELISACVDHYAHDRGFGTVLLDDGRELPFDVSACTHEPMAGETVRVRLGVSRQGTPKVVFLERVNEPEPETARLPVSAALVRLHEAGVARGFDLARLEGLVDELYAGDEQEAELVDLLAAYYEGASADAIADGWFACDWRFQNDSDDICRDLSARVGRPPLLTLLDMGDRETTDPGFSEHVFTLSARRFDGGIIERDIRSVLDVIALFNEILAQRGDPRRFRQLETDGDWYAFLLLGEQARERLTTWRVLPIVAD